MLETYYTVVIPWIPLDAGATVWHSHIEGETLTRGAFRTLTQAVEWARGKLAGAPYSVRWIDAESGEL